MDYKHAIEECLRKIRELDTARKIDKKYWINRLMSLRTALMNELKIMDEEKCQNQ